MAAGDKITEAVRILVALVGVAQDPTLLSALKAGPGIRDSLRKLAASPPPGFARLAEDLGRSAAAAFATLPEKPRDAEELYLQMMEAGLPDPARIMAERMDAAAITEGMLAGVTEREHRTPEMQALFRRLTQPALERLLADKDFAADLTPAFMRAALENFAGLAEKLDGLSRQGRDVLELLAVRFDIPRAYALSDAQLREALELRAADYRRFHDQIAAIDERTRGLGGLKAAAREAAERLDFAEVEALLARVDAAETEVAAETKLLRADNALLRGRAEEAFMILSAAADSFGGIDPVEPARRRLGHAGRLYAHGLRYGGAGLTFAVIMCRDGLASFPEEKDPANWAAGQNDLGAALQAAGTRLSGPEGAALLGEAVQAYRASLRVWTEAAWPVNWATVQSNLGNALASQGARLGGAKGAATLGQAVGAYRAALRVRTETTHPIDWAITQNNLATALRTQAERLGGTEGASLLSQAVAANRAILRVWNETDHPSDWATAQNNLGIALWTQGAWLEGSDGDAQLDEAVEACRAALRIRTEAAHPIAWAETQNNLAVALTTRGERLGGSEGAALLSGAADACRDALRVLTRAAHPAQWALTTENLGLVCESLAKNDTTPDPRGSLEQAAEYLEAAFRGFDPAAMPYNRAKASDALARVQTKLAALPKPA